MNKASDIKLFFKNKITEHSSKKIKKLIAQIFPLLEFGEEDYWLRYLKYILENLNGVNDQKDVVRSLSLIFKGGMGSFSDTVLHKNGIPLIEENNQLKILKDQLFDACEEFMKINYQHDV